MRVPRRGHPSSTSRMREAPTTQLAYSQPSDSTAQTAAGGALTVLETIALPSSAVSTVVDSMVPGWSLIGGHPPR